MELKEDQPIGPKEILASMKAYKAATAGGNLLVLGDRQGTPRTMGELAEAALAACIRERTTQPAQVVIKSVLRAVANLDNS
jgi:hypothetical protein